MRWRSPADDERGTATAELAVAVPSVVALLVLCLAGVHAVGLQVRLQDAAASAARAAARGDDLGVAARLMPGASVAHRTDGDLECVELTAPAAGIELLTLRAASCALGWGR